MGGIFSPADRESVSALLRGVKQLMWFPPGLYPLYISVFAQYSLLIEGAIGGEHMLMKVQETKPKTCWVWNQVKFL